MGLASINPHGREKEVGTWVSLTHFDRVEGEKMGAFGFLLGCH